MLTGRYRHEVKTIGNTSGQKYVTKYVVDLAVEPVITEVRIYADENGVLRIPAEYRSDVTYGDKCKSDWQFPCTAKALCQMTELHLS